MSISSIENIRSSINKYSDVARSDRFLVTFSNLGKFASAASASLQIFNAEELLQLRCEEAELPGRTIQTTDARTYGPMVKYPSLTSYSDINLTFICSTNPVGTRKQGLPEKMIFENWMDFINPSPNPSATYSTGNFWNFSYKNEYARDITITHYGPLEDEVTYAVKLIEAFPIAMNQITLGWGNDSIAKLTVSFAYTRWERITTSEASVRSYGETFETPISQIIITPEQMGAPPTINPEENFGAGFGTGSSGSNIFREAAGAIRSGLSGLFGRIR